ncbi:hypothetical protein [Streptomyces sp. XH2]|uniref:hypothetical protein n=1 Tax=Streptomyces sp. XH2 TaxID=3412483 RepID=UPI003C7A64F3
MRSTLRRPLHRSRPACAACMAALLVAGPVAAAQPASAATVIAACASRSTDVSSAPLDPGDNNNEPETVTFTGKGTINCLDLVGSLLASGTTTFSVTIPADRCTGDMTRASYTGTVNWSDGTSTTGTYTTFEERSLKGASVLTISGVTDAGSTKFPGYKASIAGLSIGSGCGTASGETSKSQDTVVTFSSI